MCLDDGELIWNENFVYQCDGKRHSHADQSTKTYCVTFSSTSDCTECLCQMVLCFSCCVLCKKCCCDDKTNEPQPQQQTIIVQQQPQQQYPMQPVNDPNQGQWQQPPQYYPPQQQQPYPPQYAQPQPGWNAQPNAPPYPKY